MIWSRGVILNEVEKKGGWDWELGRETTHGQLSRQRTTYYNGTYGSMRLRTKESTFGAEEKADNRCGGVESWPAVLHEVDLPPSCRTINIFHEPALNFVHEFEKVSGKF